jgi:ABC-type anion transport system duplicated permease subunit
VPSYPQQRSLLSASRESREQLPAKMSSELQASSVGGPCIALFIASILQMIWLAFCVLMTGLFAIYRIPGFHQDSREGNSWIALLALERILLTVDVILAVGCALGMYTGILWMQNRNHDEGIHPVVRFLAAFLMRAPLFFRSSYFSLAAE